MLRPPAHDLVGEIPVTLDELLARMLAVPGIAPTSPRFGYHIRGWNVIEKIRAAKAASTFKELIGAPAPQVPARLAAAYVFPPGTTVKRVLSGSR